ncbi:putative metal-nicotianamine transporter ysl8 [Stylosanthes scabra]|uniref:Metal-nicotianamine transporter ysl8 n=1 Tax=Stylosanthes scabra TaxID=79078 RepID=A0ABU6T3B9_9FABA|nr:putative metal-nicotianamine transporter ysl8 [Stylosanthes scabra]
MAQQRSGDRLVMENGFDSVDDHDHDHEDDGTIEHESRQNGTIELREEEVSVEKVFQHKLVPSWRNQLTLRAFAVSLALSILFTFIVMKLNLTVGIIPSLNVSAGLLGFFFVKTWTKFLEGSGMLKQPFTRQENTVIQTCVVASSGIAFSGGFGSYLFGMSKRVADQTSDSSDFKDPKLGWMIAFLFVVSFLGLFSVVPLRKIMVIDFKLTYPSGTATAHLINSFHTPQGAKLAKKQVKTLGKFFSLSFLWGFFQWFYTATDQCGFQAFPSLGLKAYQNKFYFDFSATYIGVGMICPYIINISVLLGGILSWGLMWPLIKNREGDWYAKGLGDGSLHGIQGYRVFLAIAMILGDVGGYVAIAAISTATLPHLFNQLKWYYMIVIYLIAPTLAFCNAYGNGLTDWSLASTYGKLAIFTIGAWAGSSHGGVLAGLEACGVMMNIVSTASDLMQDFKTGYLTLASPRSMFVSQVIGTSMGCVVSPCVFWIFYKAFPDLGTPNSEYPAPNATVFRNMAILGVEGFKSLPKHCLLLCYILFGSAIIINMIKDFLGKRGRYIPLPMAMAIPFYLGPYFAIDMCVGSLILFVWEKLNKAKANAFGPAVASGLICGDGIWTLPSSILALAGVKPPICMKFLSRATNARVDTFLGN